MMLAGATMAMNNQLTPINYIEHILKPNKA